MRQEGLVGVRGQQEADDDPGRGRARAAPATCCQRDFVATAPNEEWVADITYLRTWNGFVYLAFILDCYSRMMVGWQLADPPGQPSSCSTRSRWPTACADQRAGLIAYTDRGSQYTSLPYTDRVDELGITPSVDRYCLY